MMNKQELKLVSPIPPSVNHYLGYRGMMKHGKPMAMSYCTNEAKKYKTAFTKYVIEEVEKQHWNYDMATNQHLYVDVVFYFPAVDLDSNNYFKCMFDAITDSQKVWPDDNVACERVQGIYYDAKNPRVEITIHPVDYIGIFDNQTSLDSFVNTYCQTCTRFSRNCSLMHKAKLGKIQDDITKSECKKYNKKKEFKDNE